MSSYPLDTKWNIATGGRRVSGVSRRMRANRSARVCARRRRGLPPDASAGQHVGGVVCEGLQPRPRRPKSAQGARLRHCGAEGGAPKRTAGP